MCYIIFTSSSVCVASGHKGFKGSAPDNKKLPRETCHIFGWFFGTWFFADGFLFPIKELGLLTNPSHWVRVLDVCWLLYVYCIVNNVSL
jgi:hypothetical protein